MKTNMIWLLIGLLWLAGCRQTREALPAELVEQMRSGEAPGSETSPTRTSAAPPQASPSAVPTPTPAPAETLFDLAFDDRSPFRDGLIPAEQQALQRADLAGASVYHIDLTIGDNLTALAGQQAVRYTNREGVALDEVYFRLFPNLTGGRTQIQTLTIDGRPVTPTFSLAESAMRVPLDRPLALGASAVISMTYTLDVPTPESGSGGNYGIFIYDRDTVALAHFYPLIAVYDDEGWNVEMPPPAGDVVYADSSFYVVRVTAPAGQVIAASGIEIARSQTDQQQTVTFAAGPMRDFYLISSSRFEKITAGVGQTTLTHYGFPENARRNQEALAFAVAALETLNARIGLYPFTELDIAASPTRALGVEYPGIVINNWQIYGTGNQRLETTTVHEVGHQWFYSVVGNDQLDEPWLDESFAQFATLLYYENVHGPEEAEAFREMLAGWANFAERNGVAIGQPVAAYTANTYGSAVYARGPLFFVALRKEMGADAFNAFLPDYYATYKFDIATTAGLKATAERHCTCDLTPLFETWVYE